MKQTKRKNETTEEIEYNKERDRMKQVKGKNEINV